MSPEAAAQLAEYQRTHGPNVQAWDYTLALEWRLPAVGDLTAWKCTGVAYLYPGFTREGVLADLLRSAPAPKHRTGPPEVLSFTLEPSS